MELAERFWSKVEFIPFHDCWEWVGAKSSDRRGRFYRKEGSQLAHRVSYELSVGAIPDDLEIDHICCNPSCVRPDHLRTVTHKENMAHYVECGHAGSLKTHCKRGHQLEGSNLQQNKRGVKQRQCLSCRRSAYRERRKNEI